MILHMISFFLLPKGVLRNLDYYRSRFFWQGDKKEISIDKTEYGCRPKDQGRLHIYDLEVKKIWPY
jgi:hypothetical protein